MNTKYKKYGFTLIELLVVIAIIAILATLAVPTVAYAIKAAKAAKTKTFVKNLDEGANLYKNDNDYYPGQDMDSAISLTGSQQLAAALFKFEDTTAANSDWSYYKVLKDSAAGDIKIEESAGYMAYQKGMIDDSSGTGTGSKYSLIDPMYPEEMPILYFPSHYGEDKEAQFYLADNAAYSSLFHSSIANQDDWGNDDADANEWLEKHRKSGVAVNDGKFLIIAPGLDKVFFTDDDITNW